MRYVKKPVIVEAMQLPPKDEDASDELVEWLNQHSEHWESAHHGAIIIHTPEGDLLANPGWWVIKGIQGELYPCKPDIFEATYDPYPEETYPKSGYVANLYHENEGWQ